MNENPFAALFDSSDDDLLARAIDRFADGECDDAEEAELFARLDATPGAWKQCALALAEARDLRAALSGVGRSRTDDQSRDAVDDDIVLASTLVRPEASPATRRRSLVAWPAVALGLLIAFAAGFAAAPRGGADAPTLAGGQDATRSDASAPVRSGADRVASDRQSESPGASSNGPDIVNVVYRSSDAGEETSAPLTVYKSDEEWARALDHVVRQSQADLAERRNQLLAQGVDVERQILLHPVATEQGEMLLPVETFRVVPVSLDSFH